MRVVVTGGAGFIGSHIVDALIARNAEVLVIDDFSSGREVNLVGAKEKAGNRISVERMDIEDAKCISVLKDFAPDVVIHHAAQINVRRSVAEPTFDAAKNVVGTVNLLEASHRAGAKLFVMASTGGAIYGNQDVFPAPENHAIHPESPYGVSKRAGELYVEYYARTTQLSGVILRYSNVYGPRQNAKGEAGVVAIFCDKVLAGDDLVIYGDGEQTRDFVYVGDVVKANIVASECVGKKGFSVFNVGTGVETSVNTLASVFLDQWGAVSKNRGCELSKRTNIIYKDGLPGEQRRSCVDPALLNATSGWKPSMFMEEGLYNTIEYACGNCSRVENVVSGGS